MIEQTLTGWLPLTGPVTVPPHRLLMTPALTSLRSFTMEPELLMVLLARLEAEPVFVKTPPVRLSSWPPRF